MPRPILLAVAALALLVAGAGVAGSPDDGPVVHFDQQATLGFYRGRVVEYLDFGPVKLRAGNKIAPIWAFTNGADGQRNVIDTVPGRPDYTPLWDVRMATWKDAASARVLRSAAAIRKAVARGELSLQRPGVVVDCPLI